MRWDVELEIILSPQKSEEVGDSCNYFFVPRAATEKTGESFYWVGLWQVWSGKAKYGGKEWRSVKLSKV